MERSTAKGKDPILDLKDHNTLQASLDPLFHTLRIGPETQVETETNIETKIKSESETPEMLHQDQICRLESLPAELRRHILSLLDLTDLKSLQQASPTFHQQYLQDQSYVLRKSLERTLGDICLDAYATQLIMTQKIDSDGLIELYWDRDMYTSQLLLARIPNDQICSVVSFYWNVVRPLVPSCAHWALDNLAKHAKKAPHYHTMEVTITEKHRITRAAYRFYIFCYIAELKYIARSDIVNDGSPWYDGERSEMDDVYSYSQTLEAWEVEEFGVFWLFSRDTLYKKILEVEPMLGPEDEYFPRWPSTKDDGKSSTT